MPYTPGSQGERGLLECNRDGGTASIGLLKSFVNESSRLSWIELIFSGAIRMEVVDKLETMNLFSPTE
jgi:hypothetical protein